MAGERGGSDAGRQSPPARGSRRPPCQTGGREITSHGPAADFAETIIAAADTLHSAENAKHVSRTMLEHARQGFWNGSNAPFGYRTVEAEKRGQKVKKRLEMNAKPQPSGRYSSCFWKGTGRAELWALRGSRPG